MYVVSNLINNITLYMINCMALNNISWVIHQCDKGINYSLLIIIIMFDLVFNTPDQV